KKLFAYNIQNDSWTTLADSPANFGDLASATFANIDQGYVYAFRGRNSTTLMRYSVGNNSWENLNPFPSSGNADYGIALTWDGGNNIYAIRNHSNEFKRYSIISNSWADMAIQTNGGSIINT